MDAGDFARLQLYTCVGGFISACGSCVHSLGFYTVDSPGRWCLFEAVCSSFGELSVILWLIMTVRTGRWWWWWGGGGGAGITNL